MRPELPDRITVRRDGAAVGGVVEMELQAEAIMADHTREKPGVLGAAKLVDESSPGLTQRQVLVPFERVAIMRLLPVLARTTEHRLELADVRPLLDQSVETLRGQQAGRVGPRVGPGRTELFAIHFGQFCRVEKHSRFESMYGALLSHRTRAGGAMSAVATHRPVTLDVSQPTTLNPCA